MLKIDLQVFLPGAVAAQAEYAQEIIVHPDIRAGGDQLPNRFFRDGQGDDPAAFAAEHMLMNIQLTVKTVRLAGDGDAPDFANLHQRVQVTVDGAQAQPRADLPQRGADLLCG